VRSLIDHGGDITARDSAGYTLLMRAVDETWISMSNAGGEFVGQSGSFGFGGIQVTLRQSAPSSKSGRSGEAASG